MTTPSESRANIVAFSAAGWRVAVPLTVAMVVLYFGFILLVAYYKPLLGREIVSVGILLGVVVIVGAWVLIWLYNALG